MKRFFSVISAVLLFASLFSFSSFAEEKLISHTFSDGDTAELYSDGTLYINGEGEFSSESFFRQFFYNNTSDCIKRVVIGEGITEIKERSFENLSYITEVILPTTLKRIGNKTFYACTSLSDIILPEGLISIGDHAFYKCESLISIIFPSSLSELGIGVFVECSALSYVEFSDGFENMNGYTFYWCSSLTDVILPKTLKSIGTEAFSGCTALAYIELPEGFEVIGQYAFSGCTALKEVAFPESLRETGAFAFAGCTSLSSVDLPDGLISIGGGSFSGCTSLTEIILPSELDSLEFCAFENCTALERVYMKKLPSRWSYSAFEGCSAIDSFEFEQTFSEVFSSEEFSYIMSYHPFSDESCKLSFDGKEKEIFTVPGNSYAKEYSYKELRDMAAGVDFNKPVKYTREPSFSRPFDPGAISRKDIENTVGIINFFRAAARLDSVTDNDEYNEMAQAASYINYMNGSLSHNPAKPDVKGFSDELYQLGARGASSSNLAMGYSLPGSVLAYLDDSDDSNIDRVGHRRWLLAPGLDEVGIGYCIRSGAIRVFDCDNEKADAMFTAWPGGNSVFPADFFDNYQAMSVQIYNKLTFTDSVSVTVTRKSDGKKYTIDSSVNDKDSYFNVEESYIGGSDAVIFRIPSDYFGFYSGEYNIRVTGITAANGLFPVEIDYNVNMLPVLAEPGDINGDGKISASDARRVLRLSVGLEYLTYERSIRSDMNFDGKITAGDARTVLRKSVGLE